MTLAENSTSQAINHLRQQGDLEKESAVAAIHERLFFLQSD